MFSVLWMDIYEWNCKMVTISSTFWWGSFHQQIIRTTTFHILMNVCCHLLLILGILVVWSNISLWFLVCISLMVNDANHFFMGLWAFVYIFWWNVYSNPLPIFKFDLFIFLFVCFVEKTSLCLWNILSVVFRDKNWNSLPTYSQLSMQGQSFVFNF